MLPFKNLDSKCFAQKKIKSSTKLDDLQLIEVSSCLNCLEIDLVSAVFSLQIGANGTGSAVLLLFFKFVCFLGICCSFDLLVLHFLLFRFFNKKSTTNFQHAGLEQKSWINGLITFEWMQVFKGCFFSFQVDAFTF